MLKQMFRIGALVALFGLAGESQPEERSVSGSVLDRGGVTLKGAVVQLENEMARSVRSYITAEDGRFHFAGLSIEADYTLRAHYRGEWSKRKHLSEFDSGSHSGIELVIAAE